MNFTDDAASFFECRSPVIQKFNVNISVDNGGNFFVGVSKLLAFVIIFVINGYNRYLLRKSENSEFSIYKGLVLPTYFIYIYIYLFLSVLSGVIDIFIQHYGHEPQLVNIWLIPIETGLFHCLFEGLAFFLMRKGAGINAIYISLGYSLIWGFVTACAFYVIYSKQDDSPSKDAENNDAPYTVFMLYSILLLFFYSMFLIIPLDILYCRPALIFYAKFNIGYQIYFIIVVTLVFKSINESACPDAAIALAFVAILQPLALYKTLQIDSQYWQGIFTIKGYNNPLSEVWDHVGIDTANCIAENLETFQRGSATLPILHFGLLKFDSSIDFVAGGYSRVYFGKVKNEKVAFKILFAMELTPHDVKEFYREATILHALQHQNVVQCKGVCIMPPSLTLILEFCKYGSLFDFLYKPRKSKQMIHNETANSELRSSLDEKAAEKDDFHRDRDSILNSLSNSQSTETDIIYENLEFRSKCRSSEWSSMDQSVRGGGNTSRFISWSINPLDQHAMEFRNQHKNHLDDLNENDDNEKRNSMRKSLLLDDRQPQKSNNSRNSFANMALNYVLRRSDGDSYDPHDHHHQTEHHLRESRNSTNGIIKKPIDGLRTSDIHPFSTDVPSTYERRSVSADPGKTSKSFNAALGSLSQIISTSLGLSNSQTKQDRESLFGMSRTDGLLEAGLIAPPVDISTLPFAFSVSLEQRMIMMRGAVSAIEFLHAKGYMHCDIKSLNFLVDENFRIKLADMGEARLIDSPPKRDAPPIPARNWAPPEVLARNATADSYTVKSDIYGLCLVLSELILMELPFGDIPERVNPSKWYQMLTGENFRPILPESVDRSIRQVIEYGWKTDPNLRPAAEDIRKVLDTYYEGLANSLNPNHNDNKSDTIKNALNEEKSKKSVGNTLKKMFSFQQPSMFPSEPNGAAANDNIESKIP